MDLFYGANGEEKDVESGINWFKTAAEGSDLYSIEMMAELYRRGYPYVLEPDEKKAV
eukprot:CAMPEP_0197685400 /NCGR_PEP_ID=MMETSP1338-20131121/100882_1 /TAXON_ID=43686 ORGANISM="Pelagodinium beii, Strain RCC1491" /NCGR_SAMPLE_ID=MMETSP1338 /ASSEMBLY_ACC=CAM_ASM_000754 /LENGTH=56 /DNA_ID=CAMNT_0043267215 /DNA_START=21 /DNA_END=188 /DNA_ORIENTATION=-